MNLPGTTGLYIYNYIIYIYLVARVFHLDEHSMGSAILKTISRWSEAIRNWLRLPQVFPNHTSSHNFSVPGHARLALLDQQHRRFKSHDLDPAW